MASNGWVGVYVACGTVAFCAQADEPLLDRAAPFELGAAEFHGGDLITIKDLRCDRPRIEDGATCRVTGRYVLRSRDRATLLFSVTETAHSEHSSQPDEKTASITVSRGEGQYALVHKMVKGWPHVTFYDAKGRPVSGVYFGHGDSLLKNKSWRYEESKDNGPTSR
jgi:hypothetical protein